MIINWCRKEGSERNSEREKKERDERERERERERLQDRKLERRDPKSRTALVANRNQLLLDPIDDINGSSQT